MLERYGPNIIKRQNNDSIDRFLERTSFLRSAFWSYSPITGYTVGEVIPIDLCIEGDNVIVYAELPGIDSKNLTVEVDKNMLKIETNVEESNEEDSNGYVIRERRVGAMSRVIRLPHIVDPETTASTHKDGVLKITLPKLEKSKSRQIPIN